MEAWQERCLFSYKECQDQPDPRTEAPIGGMAEEMSVFIVISSVKTSPVHEWRRHVEAWQRRGLFSYKECQDLP